MEIGSHFEYDNTIKLDIGKHLNWLPLNKYDYEFTFSGRAAIELVLLDILKQKNIENVYMPSYCCDSMIYSFKKHDINVIFYDVELGENGVIFNIDVAKEVDIFFAMSYFGVETSLDKVMGTFKERNIIVLEDITHKILSDIQYDNNADYYIASLRKWFPIASGGIALKKYDNLNYSTTLDSESFVIEQLQAMKLKEKYLNGENIEKAYFLDLYKKLGENINRVDYSYKIDSTSLSILYGIDIQKVKERRRYNASYLLNNFKGFNILKLLIEEINLDIFTPLFIPIITPNVEIRNELIRHLIERNIYCPVHWPVPDDIKHSYRISELYDKEVSLICDQRYGKEHMKKIIEVLGEFENKYV